MLKIAPLSIYLILFVLTFFSAPFRASGQQTISSKVEPVIIEDRVQPGQTFSSSVTVSNLGNDPATFFAIVKDVVGLSPAGQPMVAEEGAEKTGLEISSWIRITGEVIKLGPNQAKQIPFTVEVPKNATPGAHVGVIFMLHSAEKPKETGSGVGFQIGTIISLRVAGEIIEEALLREFHTDKLIYGKPKIKFIAKVANTGNVVVKPRGPIGIADFFGKNAATIIMNDTAAAVLPNAVREFEATWESKGLVLGRYQAVLGLGYGEEGKKTISSNLSFWVLPLNIVLPVLGTIIGIVLIVFIFVKLHVKRTIREIHKNFGRDMSGIKFKSGREAPISRAVSLTIVLLVFVLLLLVILFFLFA